MGSIWTLSQRDFRTYPKGIIGVSLGFQPHEQYPHRPALPVRRSLGSFGMKEERGGRKSVIGGSSDQRLLMKESFCRPFSIPNLAVARCNSHEAFLDDCLVRAVRLSYLYLGLKPVKTPG